MPEVVVDGLVKGFGSQPVLQDVSFAVAEGELFTLLGPSGCGKTTTLLSVAGFLSPERGVIRCGAETLFDSGRRIDVPVERRNLGMVFQSYAVWPHMTVAENVAFPLRLRRVRKRDRAQRVKDVLDVVELGAQIDRYPHQLSGGQRQRVALARALVYSPAVLLLDEPFSNLDAKLRERARSWLKGLQRQLGLTTLFVTHDQDEALAMSDRILVMDEGVVQQVGTPEEVYHHPSSRFVASFVGQCNLLAGVVATAPRDGTCQVQLDGGPMVWARAAGAPGAGEAVTVAIRPEALTLGDDEAAVRAGSNGHGPPLSTFAVRVSDVAFLGDHYQYALAAGGVSLQAQAPAVVSGEELWAGVSYQACTIV